MASVWANGRLTPVYHPVGIDSVTSEKKFRRGNYDFLEWDSDGDGVPEHYINVPASYSIGTTEIQETGQEHEIGLMFGTYKIGAKIVDVNNPGDTDTWDGLHSFGYY